MTGFTQYLAAHAPNATLFTAYNADADRSGKQVEALLAQYPDTYAVYASSARHTIQVSRLLEALNLQGKIKLIGNDRFNESVEYLTRGILTAIIDKKIAEQSYRAAQTLFNYVIKGSYPASGTLQIEPAVILAGNAAFKARG
ncbi:Periplasmic binding protein domain protein [anaerobic digester metagenome]